MIAKSTYPILSNDVGVIAETLQVKAALPLTGPDPNKAQ